MANINDEPTTNIKSEDSTDKVEQSPNSEVVVKVLNSDQETRNDNEINNNIVEEPSTSQNEIDPNNNIENDNNHKTPVEKEQQQDNINQDEGKVD